MIFDSINLDEPYKFVMVQTKKSKKPINILDSAFNRTLEPNIDNLWSLKFDISFFILDKFSNKQIENPEYSSILTENLILLKTGEPSNPISQSYFIIKNVNEDTDSLIKTVECKSREEILNKNIITLDGIERELVKDEEGNYGILNLIEQQTTWKIGYVDPNCLVDNILGSFVPRVRWMDALSKPILQFLRDDIASAYNLIITFDTYNKLINVYDKSNYGNHTGIILSSENYVKSLNKSTKGDSVCTRLEVSGNDGIGISSVTLDGTSYVTNYDYYINSGQMSGELILALSNYNALLAQKDIEFKALKVQVDNIDATLVTRKSELSALEELQKGLDRIQAAYMVVADNENLPVATTNCNNNKTAIINKKAEIEILNTQLNALNVQITQIASDINKKTAKIIDTNILIFDDETLEELEDWTITEPWSSNVYGSPSLLKKAAEDLLKEYSVPVIEQSMDLVDFFAVKEAQHIRSKIKMGDLVRSYSPKLKTNIDVRIVGYSYNIDANSLSITFSNKNKKSDDARGIGSKIDKVVTSGKYVNAKRLEWDEIKGTKNAVETFLNNVLDTSAQAIISLQGKNKISINENGIFCVEKDNENNGICILAGLICITDDGFMTVKTAIDKDGIAASIIIGRLLLGEELYISNLEGTVGINGLGITIKDIDGTLKVKIGNLGSGRYGLEIYGTDGNVTVSDQGLLSQYTMVMADNVDETHALKFKFFCPEVISMRQILLSFSLEAFRSYETAVVAEAGGGTKTAEAGGNHNHDIFRLANEDPFPVEMVGNYYKYYINGYSNFDFAMLLPEGYQVTNYDVISTYTASGNHQHSVNTTHGHNLQITRGIYEGTVASNCNVYVNGVLRAGVFSTDQAGIDLTAYINENAWNTIEISSESVGRISASLYASMFLGT